jgi:hypothetical protein
MTLSEQIDYVNKVFNKSEEIGYDTFVFKPLHYQACDKATRLMFEIQCYDDSSQITVKLNAGEYLNCSLEDFLSNYFGDIINPTPEEKVMWRLQFGFDWFF